MPFQLYIISLNLSQWKNLLISFGAIHGLRFMLVYEMETLCKWHVIDLAITHICHLSDCIALNSLTLLVSYLRMLCYVSKVDYYLPSDKRCRTLPKENTCLVLKYVQNVYGLSSKPDIAFDLIIISTGIQEASWKYSWGVIL